MQMRRFGLLCAATMGFFFIACGGMQAQSTANCPAGTYDMLDWMTMDSSLRGSHYLSSTANPLYTDLASNKFYWTKGVKGFPSDIQLYDSNLYLSLDYRVRVEPFPHV